MIFHPPRVAIFSSNLRFKSTINNYFISGNPHIIYLMSIQTTHSLSQQQKVLYLTCWNSLFSSRCTTSKISCFPKMYSLSPSTKVFLRRNALTILTITSVVTSIGTGILIRELHEDFKATFTPRVLSSVKFVGDLFLQMLRSLILPLIVTSLICAIGNLNAKLNKFIGGYGVLYYMITTLLAIILGIVMAMSIRPGQRYIRDTVVEVETSSKARTNALENFMDLIRNMFPENPVQATLEQYKTVLIPPSDPNLGMYILFKLREVLQFLIKPSAVLDFFYGTDNKFLLRGGITQFNLYTIYDRQVNYDSFVSLINRFRY